MKKASCAFWILLFFLCGLSANFSCDNKSYAKNINGIHISNYDFECEYNGQFFYFSTYEFLKELNLSKHQKEVLSKNKNRLKFANDLKKLGLNTKECIDYAMPEIDLIVKQLSRRLDIDSIPDSVFVEKNKCNIKLKTGKTGVFFNVEDFYSQIFNAKNTRKIKTKIKVLKVENFEDKQKEFVEKGCFYTSFKTSGESRKNNVKTALSMFDGLVLDVGEVLSFNHITGTRSKENGYRSAKIISGGVFVEGYGGGVCQVSTTLYNACLLAGLEILEVHNHSLPVGYVEPSFDAMVNIGSSDLVVKNNSGGKIIITTSYENDICKVKIFGKENKYKIKRISEKIKEIEPPKDIVETDLSKYPEHMLEIGEEKQISFAKKGFMSKGLLEYYDKKGRFVKTETIRKDTYAPTKGIILKREK